MNRRTGLGLIASAAAAAFALRKAPFSTEARAQSIYMPEEGFPYEAFDRLPQHRLEVGGGTVTVGIAPGKIVLPKAQILAWVRKAATAVTTYYGHLPAPLTRVLVLPVEEDGIQGGVTWGYQGSAIRMLFGVECEQGQLDRDWMMTHEFVHTALPQMDYSHNWLSEGLAVYIEPIARVQIGDLTAASIWADMVRDMPKGLPHAGDRGLDRMDTWGRTYWGGALFCMECDLAYRAATQNRLGLQDAMRGVLAAGGNHDVEWPIRKILGIADKTVGVEVMTKLYERARIRPDAPDLPALWTSLGIEATAAGLKFHDDAPLASARIAITNRPTLAGATGASTKL